MIAADYLLCVDEVLELIERSPGPQLAFREQAEAAIDRIRPHYDAVTLLWLLSELARSYMSGQPGGLKAELRRMRLLAMEQASSSTP